MIEFSVETAILNIINVIIEQPTSFQIEADDTKWRELETRRARSAFGFGMQNQYIFRLVYRLSTAGDVAG